MFENERREGKFNGHTETVIVNVLNSTK